MYFHTNKDLRRISGLLLIELLYNNNEIRMKMIKMLQIYPSFGRVNQIFNKDLPKWHTLNNTKISVDFQK
jgi:hypothetical protein